MSKNTNLQANNNEEIRVRGVFSAQEIRKVGTGTTTRKSVQKIFWFVEQLDSKIVEIQPLNKNYIPTGSKKTISVDELLKSYSPEPEFYFQSVFPKIQEMEKQIDRGDEAKDKGELFSAEHAYDASLQLDENNIRANFGIGLTYLARGETDKADNIFERLVQLDAAFTEENKHLFNDFGINLRKCKMYEQAVAYYNRALELTQNDENLYINLARAYMELKNYGDCIEALIAANELDKGNETVIKFCEWLTKKKMVPTKYRSAVAAILKGEKPQTDETFIAVELDEGTSEEE